MAIRERPHRPSRHALQRGLSALLIALLAGCGGGSESDISGSAPTSPAPTAPAGDAQPSTTALAPNLIGLDEAAATATIGARYNLGEVESHGTVGGPTPRVVSQTPAAGTPLQDGTDIGLQLSNGDVHVNITAYKPQHRAVVGDTVALWAHTAILQGSASETATVAGTVVAFQRVNAQTFASASLAGRPRGNERIKFRHVDKRGSFVELSFTVLHDTAPELTVADPVRESIAMPTLPVNVTCLDDTPGCVVKIYGPATGSSRTPLATGQGRFAGTVDLSGSIGVETVVEPECPLRHCLRIDAEDTAGNTTTIRVPVFIARAGGLAPLVTLPGSIVDLDESRALSVETTGTSVRLAVYNRATGVTETVALPGGSTLTTAAPRLVPNGVIFNANPGPTIYLWRAGVLSNVASGSSLRVNGAFAIWTSVPSSSLYRFDTRSGAPTVVSTAAASADVGKDGTVVFRANNVPFGNLIRDRGGVQVALTALDNTTGRDQPLTDGNTVVYREGSVIAGSPSTLLQSVGIVAPPQPAGLLTPLRVRDSVVMPFVNYQVENGWVAFTDLASTSLQQIFVRSPWGQVTQRTAFTTGNGSIENLAANGELMAFSGTPGAGMRWFSRPGMLQVEVGTPSGTTYFVNGAWYLALGGKLLSINTQTP